MSLALFDLQATLVFPTMFRVTWPHGSEEEHPFISDRNEFCYFDLPVTLILPTKFRVHLVQANSAE